MKMSHTGRFLFALMFSIAIGFEATAADAVYSVPVTDAELVPASHFPARSDQALYGSPMKTGLFDFSLPEELLGRSTDFELVRQQDGKWSGVGTDGSTVAGECALGAGQLFTCTVAFTNLVIDVVNREKILEQSFGRGLEFDARSRVARHFEGQPIGIISVLLAPE